jgi:dihydroxyacetone kinase
MADTQYDREQLAVALQRAGQALADQHEYLTELDQAVGDGDTGITARKMAVALESAAQRDEPDLGKFLASTGMAVNSAAPSTLGTLFATALMRGGKALKGRMSLTLADLATLLEAAEQGIQERGKAKLGDKTVIDALHPAAVALRAAVESGKSPGQAGAAMLEAAELGLRESTPLRSRVGRAGWVGERTEGKVDPGCAALVIVLRGLLGRPHSRFSND